MHLWGMDTLLGEVTLSNSFVSSEGSTLKGKTLLPLAANSFLLVQTPFGVGGWVHVQATDQEVT